MWLTVVVALVLGWYGSNRRLLRSEAEYRRDAEYMAEVLGKPYLSENRDQLYFVQRLLVKYGWASPHSLSPTPKLQND